MYKVYFVFLQNRMMFKKILIINWLLFKRFSCSFFIPYPQLSLSHFLIFSFCNFRSNISFCLVFWFYMYIQTFLCIALNELLILIKLSINQLIFSDYGWLCCSRQCYWRMMVQRTSGCKLERFWFILKLGGKFDFHFSEKIIDR